MNERNVVSTYKLDDLISVVDAAKSKNVTPQAIYASIKKDQLPYVRFKGRIYLVQSDFDAVYYHRYSRSKQSVEGARVFDPSVGRVSVKLAAEWLNVSVQKIYYAIKRQCISAERIGKAWVVICAGKEDLAERFFNGKR